MVPESLPQSPARPIKKHFAADGYFDCDLLGTPRVERDRVTIRVFCAEDGEALPIADVYLSRADLVQLVAQLDAASPTARAKTKKPSRNLPAKG